MGSPQPTFAPGASARGERLVLLALFFLSGAAGLVYEVLWLKELRLLFGNTAYAAATTLAVFFLGLAVGSSTFGRRAPRIARPLRAYAWLEFAIAGSALLYFVLNPAFQWIYGRFYPVIAGHLALATLVKLVLALGIIFLPAFFMGGTLPVMGQYLVRRPGELGRTGTLLYLINTLGAATGALLAGFALPPLLGFDRSYGLAIALSCLVGLLAWRMDVVAAATKAEPAGTAEPDAVASSDPAATVESGAAPPSAAATFGAGAVRTLAFFSGFLVLGLEVVWTRMFAQVLQNSVYSFTAILVTFLAALAIGSGLANLLCRRALAPHRVLAGLALGSWILVAVSPALFVALTGGLAEYGGRAGWGAYVGRIFGLAAVVMLLPGVLAGAIYPYLLKVSERFERAPGHTIGMLAATNSVGGIVGSLLAGFVLLGVTGLWGAVGFLAAGYGAIAVAAGLRDRVRAVPRAALTAAALLAAFAPPGLALRRLPVVSFDAVAGERLLHVREGRHGTVAVVEHGENRFLKQ